MTIFFFSRLFYPHIGGVEKHVLEISKLLLRKRYSVVVISEQHASDLKLHEYYQGIEIYRIPVTENWFKKFNIWLWLLKHQQLIKSSDVIHCHDVFFWYLPFRFLFPNKKVFTTFHGYESYPIKKRTIFVRKVSEILSFGTICIGEFMKKWYFAKPNYVTYGGVEISNFKFQISNKVKKNSALFIGRLDEQTGIKIYVKACELIKKTVPNFELLVIGDGKFKSFVQSYTKILGWQQNPESYFKQVRFAFVSRYLSILEAMITKRLVFAVYDNPLKKDYLSKAPFAKNIIIISSASELADKVHFYLKHPAEEKKLIEASYKWVSKQTWDAVIDLYLNLWNIK